MVASSAEVVTERVRIFSASWPAEAAPFQSAGVKGNFLSHLSILRLARDDCLESVLILEDDAEFLDLSLALSFLTEQLSSVDWGVVQFGYTAPEGDAPATAARTLVPFRGEVLGAHCYAVHRRALPRLIEHLERQISGTPGDPVYGPMSFDGSLNTFAWVNEDLARYLLVPSVCRQRSSRSSVDPRMLDRLPVARALLRLARRARRRLRRW